MGGVITNLLYQPPKATYDESLKNLIFLKTKDNIRIAAAYYSAKVETKKTILYSHANAEDLGILEKTAMELTSFTKANVLMYDYEGYGLSSPYSQTSEQKCYNDIDAAYKYLIQIKGCLPKDIIIFGKSLGSGPSTYLANRLSNEDDNTNTNTNTNIDTDTDNRLLNSNNKTPPGGLILQSPLLSVYRVFSDFRFTLPGDMFSNIDKIKNVKCPIFIIHGTKD